MSHHFRHQPRVPKGHEGGGQWTDNPYGRATLQPVLYREPKPGGRHAVIRWIIRGAIDAALATFAWLSLGNRPGRRAVIEFRAREFRSTETGVLDLENVRHLKEDEVKKLCEKLDDVQDLTDKAVTEVRAEVLKEIQGGGKAPSDREFGSRVHGHVAREINGPGGPDDPRDTNFRAEASALKEAQARLREAQEKKEPAGEEPKPEPHELQTKPYATKGTIRVDVFENLRNGTVCIYDIKTGDTTRLNRARIVEIARTIAKRYGGAERIVITEVRPRRAPAGR